METRLSRANSSSSSLSRSRSPISNNEKRNISTSPKQAPSTPVKSLNDGDGEQVPLVLDDNNDSKIKIDKTPSPMMSDIDQNDHKKKSHHRHHRHHHHRRKQSKSNKRLATHHQHSVKRKYILELVFSIDSFFFFLVGKQVSLHRVITNQMIKILLVRRKKMRMKVNNPNLNKKFHHQIMNQMMKKELLKVNFIIH